MVTKYRIGLLLCLTLLVACQSGLSPREKMLKRVFLAIQAGDWESYKKELITTADFMYAAESGKKLGPFKKKQSYTFGVLKPRILEQRRAEFDRAVKGGAGMVNFSSEKFIGEGDTLSKGAFFESGAVRVYVSVMSLKLEANSNILLTTEQSPAFQVVLWQEQWKLVGLFFPDEEKDVPTN